MPPSETIALKPGVEGFVPDDKLTPEPEGGWNNPVGDKMSGTEGAGFEAFETGVMPPGGFPEGVSVPAAEPAKETPKTKPEAAEENPEGDRAAGETTKKAKPAEQDPPDKEAEPDPDKPAEATETAGKELDSPDSPVQGILEKYGTPEALAKGFKSIQQLATLKGEELKTAQGKLDAQTQLVDEYFVADAAGNMKMRTDKVVEFLQGAQLPPSAANVAQIREGVVKERRKMFEDAKIEDEHIDIAIENAEKSIDAETQQRVEAHQHENQRQQYELDVRAKTIAHQYFSDNPKHREVVKEIDARWYRRFPKALRTQVINEGWLPIPQIAQAEYLRKMLPKIVQEAYDAGLENREIKPTEGTTPSSSAPAPATREIIAGPDAVLKENILNAGVMEGLESIFPDD